MSMEKEIFSLSTHFFVFLVQSARLSFFLPPLLPSTTPTPLFCMLLSTHIKRFNVLRMRDLLRHVLKFLGISYIFLWGFDFDFFGAFVILGNTIK